jgi:aspartate/methionine/tyrosine aminotransferase
MLTASTSEAYAYLFKLLCDPGDEVLVPAPSYPLFDHLAGLEGVSLVPYRLAYDGEWHVDVPHLRAAVGAKTRAILAVSPNNPTGSYLKRDELAAMAALGLPIVSDEVFAAYPLKVDARRAESALEAARETLVFALGGLSKLAGLPQMKLAWTCIAGPEAPRDEALARLELIADTFLSPGTPVQAALPRLLAAGARTRAAIAARTRTNLEVVRRACAGSAASVLDVEGGWYATLRVPHTCSEEAWVLALLERDGVYVHPGWFFDFAEDAVLVVSLLTPEPALAEGIARIVARVEAGA